MIGCQAQSEGKHIFFPNQDSLKCCCCWSPAGGRRSPACHQVSSSAVWPARTRMAEGPLPTMVSAATMTSTLEINGMASAPIVAKKTRTPMGRKISPVVGPFQKAVEPGDERGGYGEDECKPTVPTAPRDVRDGPHQAGLLPQPLTLSCYHTLQCREPAR